MPALYDSGTGFFLGNSSVNPLLPEENSTLPDHGAVLEKARDFILSASGWRSVFTATNSGKDNTAEIGPVNKIISALIGLAFVRYLKDKTGKNNPVVTVGIDTRPTGPEIADVILRVLAGEGLQIQYLFIVSAPEIMSYAKSYPDGFVYISASHNPIGHNGIKFGLNDGGVVSKEESEKIIAIFKSLYTNENCVEEALAAVEKCTPEIIEDIYKNTLHFRTLSNNFYNSFSKEIYTGCPGLNKKGQHNFFDTIRNNARKYPVHIVADMNGSARTLSNDNLLFEKTGITFSAFNSYPRQIVHEIIPEPENLVYCAKEVEKLHSKGTAGLILGYMPDCDGDRGNIVFFDETQNKARVLMAQEVFALSVLSELAFSAWTAEKDGTERKTGVVTNDPTSIRIEEIADAFNAKTFRAEVGEANVVNKARELREEGWNIPILGEGSNGGNITYPAAVRDPRNTLFALVKLYLLRDTNDCTGLFHNWCIKSKQENKYREDFSFGDIISTLPVYTTTGVSEKQAVMNIKNTDHGTLKKEYQKYFEKSWKKSKKIFSGQLGISGWKAFTCNGTVEKECTDDFSVSGRGGLKIAFYPDDKCHELPVGFIWMRGSGTEPVFRVMCDIKGDNKNLEEKLLLWHKEIIKKADE